MKNRCMLWKLFLHAEGEAKPAPNLEFPLARLQFKSSPIQNNQYQFRSTAHPFVTNSTNVGFGNPTTRNSCDPIATSMYQGRVGLMSTSVLVALGEPFPARILQYFCGHFVRKQLGMTDIPLCKCM